MNSNCVEFCLTFRKGVVIECPHCGHHMWRDGFTDYVKLILNLEDGSCCDSKPCHLQKLRCSNPNCSSHRVRKDNPGKHKDVLHETHVMLPEHGLPRYEVQAGNFDDFHLIAVQISNYVQKMREAGKLKERFHLTHKLFLKILGNKATFEIVDENGVVIPGGDHSVTEFSECRFSFKNQDEYTCTGFCSKRVDYDESSAQQNKHES